MVKTILTSLLIFVTFSFFGQTFTKLTDYHSNDFYLEEETVLERNGHYYRIVPNNSNKIEVWEFLGDTVNKIYESKAFLCKDEFFSWKSYNDYLIFYADEKFRLENIFNDEVSEEIFIDKDTLDKVYKTNYSINKGVLRILDYKTFEYYYDIDHKEFVPPIKDYITYRTKDYYYFWHSEALTRRPYNNEEMEIISSNLELDFHQTVENRFYCQNEDKTLLMVDENDSIYRQYYFDTYFVQVFPIDSNKMIAFGYNPSYDLNYFFSFDKNNLEFGDTLAKNMIYGNLNFNFQYYYDNKILFTTAGNSCYETVLKLYDFKKKKMYEEECLGLKGNVLSPKGDSIVFIEDNSPFYNNIFALNMKDNTSKRVDLRPYEKSGFERNPYILHYKNGNYLRVINKFKGKTYAKYDYNQNRLNSTSAYIYKEYGIGKSMHFEDDIVYLYNNSGIKILDKTKTGNLNIHNFSKPLKSNLILYKGNFYYLQSHNNSKHNFDLIKYNPKLNQEQKLFENLSNTNITSANIVVKEKFLIIKMNDNPFDMFDQYEYWKIYDLENEKMLNLNAEQVEFINKIFFSVSDYYYTFTGNINNRKYYKIPFNDLNQKEETKRIQTSAKLIIDENAYSYVLNNDMFYCENGNCEKLNITVQSYKNPEYFITPNKRFFGLLTQNVTSNNQLIIYDRQEKSLNEVNLQDFGFTGKSYIRYVDNEFIYLKRNLKNDNVPVYMYGLLSKKIKSVTSSNSQLDYISINKDEIHLLSNDKILVFDKELNQLETVEVEKINFNQVKEASSYGDSIRIIFIEPYTRPVEINNTLYTYNQSKRELTKYFECEDSLLISDIAITDTTAFCLLNGNKSGFQIYETDFKRHYSITDDNKNLAKNKMPVTLYPNPVQDQIFFDTEISNYRVFSITGRLLKVSNAKTDRIDVSSLQQGMYIIKFELSGIPYQLKFVKSQ